MRDIMATATKPSEIANGHVSEISVKDMMAIDLTCGTADGALQSAFASLLLVLSSAAIERSLDSSLQPALNVARFIGCARGHNCNTLTRYASLRSVSEQSPSMARAGGSQNDHD